MFLDTAKSFGFAQILNVSVLQNPIHRKPGLILTFTCSSSQFFALADASSQKEGNLNGDWDLAANNDLSLCRGLSAECFVSNSMVTNAAAQSDGFGFWTSAESEPVVIVPQSDSCQRWFSLLLLSDLEIRLSELSTHSGACSSV